MKRIKFLTYFFALSALMASVQSCDKAEKPDDGTVTLSFRVMPETLAKAVADGSCASALNVYAYDLDGQLIPGVTSSVGTVDLSSGRAYVSLKLVKGESYDVVFLSLAPTNPYSYDASSSILSVNYGAANSEGGDVFAARCRVVADTARSITLVLRRKVAQVLVASSSDDYAAAVDWGLDMSALQTSISVSRAWSDLNLLTDEVSGPAPVDFSRSVRVSQTLSLSGDDFYILSYAYFFASAADEDVDLVFKADLASAGRAGTFVRDLGSLPVRANYRSTVKGRIFSATDGTFLESYIE